MKKRIWFDVIPVYVENGRIVREPMNMVDTTYSEEEGNSVMLLTPDLEFWLIDMLRIDQMAFEEMLTLLDKESDDYRLALKVYKEHHND